MTTIDLNPKSDYNCVAIFSGGLDSTTLVYHLLDEGRVPHLISFDYGQRHRKELDYARATAGVLNLRHDIVDLSNITHLISNSALTAPRRDTAKIVHSSGDDGGDGMNWIEVPEGHYAEDNMKKTVVPNRNMIMISIASAVAVNNGYDAVYTGVHAGDHFVYPDCRPPFISAVNTAVVLGNAGFGPLVHITATSAGDVWTNFVKAPFLNKSKEDIASRAISLDVPFEVTWSCYKGGDIHCGKCGTCVERLEAIQRAHDAFGYTNHDLSRYEDKEYWKEAVGYEA